MSFETLLDKFEEKVVAFTKLDSTFPPFPCCSQAQESDLEQKAKELEAARKDLVDYVRSQYRL